MIMIKFPVANEREQSWTYLTLFDVFGVQNYHMAFIRVYLVTWLFCFLDFRGFLCKQRTCIVKWEIKLFLQFAFEFWNQLASFLSYKEGIEKISSTAAFLLKKLFIYSDKPFNILLNKMLKKRIRYRKLFKHYRVMLEFNSFFGMHFI